MNKIIKIISSSFLLTTSVAEASSGGVDVAANLGILFDLASFVTGVIGFFLVASGLFGLYTWSKTGGQGKTIGKTILTMLVGTFLASIGWFYELIKGSFVTDSKTGVDLSNGQINLALDQAALKASEAIGSSGFGKFMPEGTTKAVLAFVFLVGFVAFISGVYSLKDVGDNKSQHPYLSPIVKIFGGMICMNIIWFACLVSSILDIPALCAGG